MLLVFTMILGRLRGFLSMGRNPVVNGQVIFLGTLSNYSGFYLEFLEAFQSHNLTISHHGRLPDSIDASVRMAMPSTEDGRTSE